MYRDSDKKKSCYTLDETMFGALKAIILLT